LESNWIRAGLDHIERTAEVARIADARRAGLV
jgi:hypothetical protein